MKNKKIALNVIFLLMLLFTYGLGYWAGFSHARKVPRVVVAKDTADNQPSSGNAGYEPYFTKQNSIPDKVK